MYVYLNTEARLCYLCCSGKAVSVTYCECVFVALGIRHAKCMLRILFVACPARQYFSTLSRKRHIFERKSLTVKCVLIFSTSFVRNISHSKKI